MTMNQLFNIVVFQPPSGIIVGAAVSNTTRLLMLPPNMFVSNVVRNNHMFVSFVPGFLVGPGLFSCC